MYTLLVISTKNKQTGKQFSFVNCQRLKRPNDKPNVS